MTAHQLAATRLELTVGDITRQPDLEAVVNAANAQLMPGGGVAGAIHRAAGPGLAEECRPLAPISPGQAVITGAHRMPNKRIIHCLGPVYGSDEPAADLLAACYRNALALAEEERLGSVGFPAISTGAFGYPLEEAAEVALGTVIDAATELRSVRLIRFVLFSPRDLAVHEAVLERLVGES
ncbi:MAG: Appr-1-p processing protein [Acidimicrobiales bacterium]|nr:MAG: Appr-1-p processing protein [Acidimicrobiales bacterium]